MSRSVSSISKNTQYALLHKLKSCRDRDKGMLVKYLVSTFTGKTTEDLTRFS